MNDDQGQSARTGEVAPPNKVQTCELCGRFDAIEIAGRYLCEDCYGVCGSGCSG